MIGKYVMPRLGCIEIGATKLAKNLKLTYKWEQLAL